MWASRLSKNDPINLAFVDKFSSDFVMIVHWIPQSLSAVSEEGLWTYVCSGLVTLFLCARKKALTFSVSAAREVHSDLCVAVMRFILHVCEYFCGQGCVYLIWAGCDACHASCVRNVFTDRSVHV